MTEHDALDRLAKWLRPTDESKLEIHHDGHTETMVYPSARLEYFRALTQITAGMWTHPDVIPDYAKISRCAVHQLHALIEQLEVR